MWHEQLFNILNAINNVVLTLIGIPFMIQIIFMLFGWLRKKKFPKSEKKNRICILFAARNEEDVIKRTISRIFERQKYDKNLYDVYVVAHNCTDKTAEFARMAGATVFEYSDPNPKTHRLAYAIKYGFKKILEQNKKYDFLIRLDADNFINDEFLDVMNDAYNAGVKLGRPYESALNITQNKYTKASGLYYAYDSRFASRVRERFHLAAHINGPGAMFAMDLVEKYGYDAEGLSDDSEYLANRMLNKVYGHFVEDAVVYEDLPSTFKDTYARNKRMGYGVSRLFFTHGFRLLGKFFTTFNFSFIEVFFQFYFCVICAVLCTYIPIYYIYDITYLALAGTGVIETTLQSASYYMGVLEQTGIIVAIALSVLFAFAGILQAFLLVMSDYKKLGAKSRKELMSGIIIYPCFVVVYCLTLFLGIVSRPSWNKVNRNKIYNNFDNEKEGEEK